MAKKPPRPKGSRSAVPPDTDGGRPLAGPRFTNRFAVSFELSPHYDRRFYQFGIPDLGEKSLHFRREPADLSSLNPRVQTRQA